MVSFNGFPSQTSPLFKHVTPASSKQLTPLPPSLLLSHTRATSSNQFSPLPSSTTMFHQAIVIHLENVLVPTKWMADRLGLNKTAQGLDTAQQHYQQTPELQAALYAIEDAAIQLLQIAMSLGPVFLVSDTVTYVEVFCSVFFPRLASLLQQSTIHVMGASTTSLSLMDRAVWKMDALRTICCEKLYCGPLARELLAHPQTGRFAIVSLNAHEMDEIAATRAKQSVAPHAVLKSCKVKSTCFGAMELEQFHAQVEILTRFLLEATAQDAPVRHAL